jgi:hypothetical protein
MAPPTWVLPTFQAERDAKKKKALGLDPSASLAPADIPHPAVNCVCGRITTDDMLTDIRTLPANIRSRTKIPAGVDFICDACLETEFREGRAAHHDFYGALGAANFPQVHKVWKDFALTYPYPKNSHAHNQKQLLNNGNPNQ